LPASIISKVPQKTEVHRPVPTPARRSRLDTETVVAAAENLVDEHGIDAVTMTMLAAELGTRVSSLYNHVASLEDLRSELQVRAIRYLGTDLQRSAMGASGKDGLLKLADTFRSFSLKYPNRYDTMTRPIVDRKRFLEASADAVGALLAMIGSTGVSADEALSGQAAFFAAVHGFAALETSGFFAPPDDRGISIDFDAVYAQVVRGAISAIIEST